MAYGETYEQFVDKFKPKKTTDDCMTPAPVYEAVAAWVAREYGMDRASFVRPFWPGGDFEAYDYPAGCVVVDNPPFSILARIVRFYAQTGVRFFLFAPTLTHFSRRDRGVCFIPCGATVTYANGAEVSTSFITNLEPYTLRTAPELYRTVKAANAANVAEQTKQLPKYSYPPHVLTAAGAYIFGKYVDFCVAPEECRFIRTLDAMKANGQKSGIFGAALLLSDAKAAERAAAERAAAHVWQLSPRERAIIDGLKGI